MALTVLPLLCSRVCASSPVDCGVFCRAVPCPSPGLIVTESGVGPSEVPRGDVPFGCSDDVGAGMLQRMAIGTDNDTRIGEANEGGVPGQGARAGDDPKRITGYRVGKSGATVLAQALLVNTTLVELRSVAGGWLRARPHAAPCPGVRTRGRVA